METIVKAYIVTLRHDNGSVRIRTAATSPQQAKTVTASAEGCPITAIQSVREAAKKNQQ